MKKVKINYILKGLFVFFLGVNWVLGQRTETGSPYLPNIIPPSPNAASLGKYGDIPVGIYTGIPSISIPIYTINSRGENHSISLSYHSNGLKVEEVASNVGLGWSLNAGGVITRTVRGLPDNLPTAGYLNNTVNYSSPTGTQICDYFVAQRTNNIDLHPDTYVFNAGGMSGKFVIQKDVQGKIMGFTLNNEGNLKIEWISEYSWKIIDPSGTEYYFGTSIDGVTKAVDKTASTPKDAQAAVIAHVSAWYLMEIVASNGETIKFNYEGFENTSCQRGGETTYYQYFSSGNGCGPLPASTSFSETITSGSRLKEINFQNGIVKFNYSTIERKDFKGDYPLDNVKVYSKDNLLTPTKTFKLTQGYFDGISNPSPLCGDGNITGSRLKLLSVMECDKNNICLPPHEFSYFEDGTFPDRFSNAQDYWGYYNGANNNSTLIPQFGYQVPNGNFVILPGSNRAVDESIAFQRLTILKSIKYPTGGTTAMNYESNSSLTTDFQGETFPGTFNYATITGRQYTNNNRQTVSVTFTLTTTINAAEIRIYSGGIQCDNTVRDGGCGVFLSLTGPVNIPLSGFSTNSQGSFVTQQKLLAGTYTLELEFSPQATNSFINGFGCTIWGPKPRPNLLGQAAGVYEKSIGGLRIKSTVNKSCETCQEEVTNYKYVFSDGLTSGVLVTTPKYDYIIGQVGEAGNGQAGCLNLVRTSFSQVPMGITQGSHIGYSRIEVIKGIGTNTTGKSVNFYSTATNYPDLGSNNFPFAPQTTMDWKRGILTNSEDYIDDGGGTLRLIKKLENTYSFSDSRFSKINKGLQISKTILGTESFLNPACANLVTEIYNVQAGWLHLDLQKNSEIDKSGNIIETISSTTYAGADLAIPYFQPSKTLQSNSKGEQITTVLKYSYDLADAISVGMKNKNIISPILEKTTTLVGTTAKPISYEKTTYDLYSSKFYLPKKIETQSGSGPLTTAIIFDSYNGNGSLTQYTAKNGLKNIFTYFGSADVGKTNLLNTQTNNSSQTTTYDHLPLIGLSTITDPNGKVTTYNYDSFNRLKSIADQDNTLKTYAYNYGSNPDTGITPIGAVTGLNPAVQECKMCCLAEAEAGSNSPITNCTSGQITLSGAGSSTGTDITYAWSGPNSFASTEISPIITGDITKAGGVYTLVVTKLNSTCEATAMATTNVLLDCICPFTINTNGTTVGPLDCQQTISLVGNCVGCSTGDPAPGTENYVVNGKFDGGSANDPLFSSDCGGGFLTNNPNSLNGTFNSFGDHTTGNGTMFLTGGSSNTNERVWYQTITVKPNTRYVISSWITSAYNNNPTKVNWDVNGVLLPEQVDMINKIGGQWMQLKSTWVSGSQTSIVLAMRKQNTQGHNWFAFDDISITEVKPAAKYSWSGPDNFVSTSQNPFVRNVGLKNGGTYMLTVIDNGCTKISKVNVTVSCQACLDVNPLTVYLNTNTPVSCGSNINLIASANKTGVAYTWYKINPDGTDLLLPSANTTDKTLNITAPSVTGLTRYGYMVAAFKNGCTASYTAPVEVKCIQDGDVDIAINLRVEGGSTTISSGQTFGICADMINQSTTRNAGSVRARVLLPDCLEYIGDPWGLNTGAHQEISGNYYEDTWYNLANREVTNLSTADRRGGNTWQYWGVPIGANQTRSMCFQVKALTSGTIVVRGQVAVIETTSYQNMKDSDSEPNNGYDNGEDDRSGLILNPSSNTLDLSTFQLRTSFAANSNDVEVISGNANWTATVSDSWISINKTSGGNFTTTVTVSLSNNVSAKSRFGFVTFSAGCGLSKILKIKQSGKDDCPTVDLSSNNPYCKDQLQLFANIVPSVNKDLVSNGNFEKGDADFSPESYHYYNWQTGGSLAYVVSSNPKTENGNLGMWFIDKECPGENANPNCKVVNRVRLLFRNDCCLNRLNGARIQGSNNKSQWNDLYTFENATGAWQDVSFSNASNYMYVRFVAGPNGYGELRELEFYNGTTKLTGQVFGSSGILNGYVLANATDGLETEFWHSTGVGEDAYVGLELLGCSLAGNVASSTSGSGKQMAIAASWRQRDAFWSQTILVDPYTDYNISVKAVQLGNYDDVPLQLIFDVDGVPTTIQGTISTTGCTWQKIGGLWNSGEKFGPVKLTLRFVNPNSNNKLFAIDDISVKPNITGITSNNKVTYSWIAPNKSSQDSLKSSNIANPIINKVKGINAGIYTLTVVQNGCPVTEMIDVDIACSSVTCPAPTLTSPYARICTNMGQSTSINAFGCPDGSTVKWSDGQVSALLPFSTDPATGKVTSYISTIQTAKIQQGTNYSAQCQTDCGLSNKSLDLFVHAVGVPNPPVINGGEVITLCKSSNNGFILNASGCNDGIIEWSCSAWGSTKRTGTSIWVEALGINQGASRDYQAVCITECSRSTTSNTVRVIVDSKIVSPEIIVSESPSICGGGAVTLEARCPSGISKWYIDGIWTVSSIYKTIVTSDKIFRARCEDANCNEDVSDFAEKTISVTGKPITPFIHSPSGGWIVCKGATVVLNAGNCPAGAEVTWSDGQKGQAINFVTSTTLAKQTVRIVSCKVGACLSDPSEWYDLNLIDCNVCTPRFSISPSVISVIKGSNTSVTITSSGCTGSILWSTGEKTASITKIPSVGASTFSAYCLHSDDCEEERAITIALNDPSCSLAVSVSLDANTCGFDKLKANITPSSSGATYQWYRENTAITNANTSIYSVTESGNYKVEVTQGGCTAISSLYNSSVIVAVSPPLLSGTTIIVVGSSTSLSATGCSGTGDKLNWTGSDGTTYIETPITVSPLSTITYTATCTNSDGCISAISNTVTVSVTSSCSTFDPIFSLKPDGTTYYTPVCKGVSTNIGVTVTGCASGTIKWYDSNLSTAPPISTSRDYMISVTSSTSSNYYATCSIGNCTSEKKAIQIIKVSDLSILLYGSSISICKSGSTYLEVKSCTGTVNWSDILTHETRRTISGLTVTTTYRATCIKSGSCDSDEASVKITVSEPLIPTTTQLIHHRCTGYTDNITLSASGCSNGTINWYDNYGFTGQGSSIVIKPTFSKKYYAYCKEGSCTSSNLEFDVQIHYAQIPTVSSGNSTICPGSSVKMVATGCNGTISWSDGTTGAIVVKNPSASTLYSATCTESVCVSETSNIRRISVSSYGRPTITTNTLTPCSGTPAELFHNGCNGTTTWNDGSTGNPRNVTPTTATNYSATCTGTTSCLTTVSNIITITPSSCATATVVIPVQIFPPNN